MIRWSKTVMVASCALLAGGCLREPTFTFRDAAPTSDDAPRDGVVDGDGAIPPSEDVTATVAPGGTLVEGPGYTVLFGDEGFSLPRSVQLGGVEMLGEGRACNDESGAGIALYPPLAINGFESFGRATAFPRVVLDGPALVQVEVSASAMASCGGEAFVNVTSMFTFYADGRVTRHDTVDHPSMSAASCATCGGDVMNGTFYLTSYVTLAADGAVIDSDFGTPSPAYNSSVMAQRSICLTRSQQRFAVAWDGLRMHRLRTVEMQPHVVAYVEDLATGSMITTGLVTARSTWLLGGTEPCSVQRDRAEAFFETRDLSIETSSGTSPIGPSPDGVYGSPPFVFDPPVGAFTLRPQAAPILGAWALRVEFGAQPTQNVSIVHSNAAKQSGIRTQRVPSTNQLVIVVRDPLEMGESIVVTPG